MPRITHPVATDWSHEVELAIATFGNRSRNEIIRYLLEHSPAARGDIVANVGASEASVAKHLLLLEDAGAITADVEPGRRHGRAPRYSVNSAGVKALMDAHLRYLTDPTK